MIAFVPPYLLGRLAEATEEPLRDLARRTLDLDARWRAGRAPAAPRLPVPGGAERTVHDAGQLERLPGRPVRAEGRPPTGDDAVDEAYDWLGRTYRGYLDVYSRRSLDDAGLPLVASVHYGQGYANAFWTGEQAVYGDGDGRVFRRLTIPLTVTAHELTHGVIQYTAALEYNGQAGALNESVADVFASLVEQYTRGQAAGEASWLVGDGVFTPQIDGVALRSLKAPGTAYDDPLIGADPQPSTMAGYVETEEDNGGVHINSGIPNHAFYLVASRLGGHAWQRAGQVWYDTLTGGALPPDADFATFAQVTVEAAAQRYGTSSAEADAVRAGWSEVGIPVAPGTPGRATVTPGPPTTPGQVTPGTPTRVAVTRTGGIAGMHAHAEVDLDVQADPGGWRALVAACDLDALPEHRPQPDRFVYEVRIGPRSARVGEHELTPALSELVRRVLAEGS
ncbi:MAG: protealysin inhibitor emfourin [Streptomycetales bacterium]